MNKSNEWINCETCGKEIRRGYAGTHNQKAHSETKFISRIAAKRKKIAQTKERPKVVKPPEVVFRITSKRGTVIGNSQCTFCEDDFRTGWRYQSDRGPVILCGPCKSRYLIAQSGLGMPKPREVVTNFETNRKRH